MNFARYRVPAPSKHETLKKHCLGHKQLVFLYMNFWLSVLEKKLNKKLLKEKWNYMFSVWSVQFV